MNTYFALLAEYGTAQIPVEKCARLFGLSVKKAEEYARRQILPVPAYRIGSQKSPWLIDAGVLAKYLDCAKNEAQKEWAEMRSP
ncbi:pyocin activator PrtN family protein [Acidovorax delafieldii]|uniref:pyocin activator PrtN family protein n=1 Tax=Acidovorax delafieldii TaxID=47920 RepID=UPI003ECCB0A3